jgi:hypothetical protein
MRHLLVALLAAAAGPSDVDSLQYRRRDYPLNCRGGGLAFDTLGGPSDTHGAVALSLTFAASPLPSGPEGQGLRPGTCAWVDRPVNDAEPRQVWFTTSIDDSILQLTVHDSSQYWGFLALNSDSGHLSGVGHRHWNAGAPPLPMGPGPASLPPAESRWLMFVRQHLVQVVLGLVLAWVAIALGPLMVLVGFWSGWRRLARLYPSHELGRGPSFRSGMLIMGTTNYRGGARLTADSAYLRFSMSAILRPGHPPFSVPWSDVTLALDEWPWFPFKGKPVVRISLARHPGLRILVPPSTGEKIVAASEARYHLHGPREHAVATT